MKTFAGFFLLAIFVAVSFSAGLPPLASEVSVKYEIPAFDCTGKNGYYADAYRRCHVFYRCLPDGSKWAFACPLELLFSDEMQSCLPAEQVACYDPYKSAKL